MLDHLFLAAAVVWTGGGQSPFWLLFPVAILSVPKLRRFAKLPWAAVLSALVFLLAVVGHAAGTGGLAQLAWGTILGKAGLLVLLGVVSVFLLSCCRFREPVEDR